MWKRRGNDLDQSKGFVMLPLSNVVGSAKTFFVTRHQQVTLVTYSKFVIVNGIPDSRLLFQIGVVCMEHFRKVKKEGNKVKLLMMQRLHNLQHRNISALTSDLLLIQMYFLSLKFEKCLFKKQNHRGQVSRYTFEMITKSWKRNDGQFTVVKIGAALICEPFLSGTAEIENSQFDRSHF